MKNEKQTLWIISEPFPPDETSTSYILGEIANAMAEKYNVGVICGPEIYDKQKKLDTNNMFKLDNSITVIRSEIHDFDKNTFWGKLLRFILLSIKMNKNVKRNVKTGDKVLMVTNPAPLVAMVSRLRKKREFEFNLLVHDIFPENTKPASLKLSGGAYKLIKRVFDKAYSRADRMIALGRDMKTILAEKVKKYKDKPNIEIIENWGDVENIQPRPLGMPQTITIQYAGNIGKVQGIQAFMELMKETSNPYLKFELWGTGSAENSLKEYVAENRMKNVAFHGAYLRSQQNEVLNDCSLALVTLSEGMLGLGVPSKTYNILAAGKPILYIGDRRSEISLLINEYGLGFTFEPNEHDGLLSFLNNLNFASIEELKCMGEAARRVAVDIYSKDKILEKYRNL